MSSRPSAIRVTVFFIQARPPLRSRNAHEASVHLASPRTQASHRCPREWPLHWIDRVRIPIFGRPERPMHEVVRVLLAGAPPALTASAYAASLDSLAIGIGPAHLSA